ncbi:DUF4166 domain-containing protein [Microbacterium marinilacus]|uniref:DUF4166 domain-containing protein n=1 Tax=Microbacterium marinilacus TaxID=415209 RepID=A0ABP7BYU6_9MICO|nr:DUF4166 domain-containing protein [Microbacterium marinilacus]MBY0688132.1 DUF4166 domain-containing protein [Microbacterium marinilacus]
MSAVQSPYERALGARLALLHPVLQSYFRAVPAGSVGVGEGVFRVAGTRNRLLRPLLRVFERDGVAFAGWERDVPFRVENRTAGGRTAARREFRLTGRTWTMTDAVGLSPRGALVDTLGRSGAVAARFRVDVVDGALVLTSERVGVRFGGLRLRIPRPISPRIRLVERFDGVQHVDVEIEMPVIGRVYEYSGSFTYEVLPLDES